MNYGQRRCSGCVGPSRRLTTYPSSPPTNGQPVDSRETMLRFAAPTQWDRHGRPTAAALSVKPDEDGLSVYLAGLLASLSLDERDIVTKRPGYGVLAMRASTAQLHGCVLLHDPITSIPTDPTDSAHALIVPPDQKPQWKLARAALIDEARVLVPPG
jgi:hypothetical protein